MKEKMSYLKFKVAKEYERDPSDKKRKRYVNLSNEVAEARLKN